MDPEFYAKSNAMQKRDSEAILKMYGKEMNKDLKPETILDLGCGPGNITCDVVAPNFPNSTRIVGADKSPEMIKHATLYFRRESLSYAVLDVVDDQDVEKFINNHGTFSKVVSFYCLHWIKDHRKALENIKRLLTDEGECLLMFVSQCPVFIMYEKLAKKPEWAEYMSDFEDFVPYTQHSLYPDVSFSKLMKEAGLEKKICELMNESYTFESTEDLIDGMKAVNPFIPRLPEDKVPEYIKDCLMTLSTLAHKPSAEESEGHKFDYELLVALGRRQASE